MTDAARQARLSRPAGTPPTIAIAGDVDPAPLRQAGWQLRGVLSNLPYADRLDAATYVDPAELLDDPALDAVAVDGDDPELARLLPELRGSGLLLLLPTAAPLDAELVRAARLVPDAADACVGLRLRWQPWALTVAAALPLAGGPPVQVTVRGWPRGRQAAAELVDLVGAWCDEVVAVIAAPAVLPAEQLPATGAQPPAAVSWALLTACGATVLISHEGGPVRVRLSFATARLEAGPTGVRWAGGAELPLLSPPEWVPQPAARTTDLGLVATATALLRAVGGGEVPAHSWPWAADLGDLLVISRVLSALRASARIESIVPVA
ncbi:MAG: hypothetical protein ACR2K2_09765 [Mycobacteriales bacterium]